MQREPEDITDTATQTQSSAEQHQFNGAHGAAAAAAGAAGSLNVLKSFAVFLVLSTVTRPAGAMSVCSSSIARMITSFIYSHASLAISVTSPKVQLFAS